MSSYVAEVPLTAADERPSWVSDALNPIFVREVQQSLKSRAFLFTMLLSLSAVVVIAVVIASARGAGMSAGREAFEATLTVMAPILLLIVPLQAFHSMRQEMRGGTAELLLLSSLTPWRIIGGKLMAAMAHFLLYIAVFAPLIALTFLLRGVDVVTIAVSLALAAMTCMLACMLAITMGTLTRWRAVGPLMGALAVLALTALTIPIMVGISAMNRDFFQLIASGVGWQVVGTILFFGASLLALFAVIAAGELTHPNENRSTAFRALLVVIVSCTLVWVWALAPAGFVGEALAVAAAACTIVASVFFVFIVTEEEQLSPRARLHVPKSKGLALLAVPFLPGGGRGLLFAGLLLASVTVPATVIPAYVWSSMGHVRSSQDLFYVPALASLYAFFYAALGRLIRGRLRSGVRGTWLARILLPSCLIAACVLPFIPDVLLSHWFSKWSFLHLLNPFYTFDTHHQNPEVPALVMAVLCLAALGMNLRSIARGVTEVLEAARTRRARG